MLCPRCNADFHDRFCPECGLDLQIYAEVDSLKAEVESLRQLVSSDLRLSPDLSGGVTEPGKLPPPLPTALLKSQRTKNAVEGNSAEVAVGQKWLLGIGVLILIIGVGFFLKYAFDQQWIGPAVRISIGFICGLLLLLGGNICRQRNLRGLDVGIGAVGLGTLYLTSYAASQVDRFLPASLTLVLILLTTAVGVSLAILWASQALAMLAFMGGYLAPLLFASALFDRWLFLGYLLILTLGGQVLAYARDWRPLYSSGAVWTWLSIVIWSQRDYRKEWFLETLVFTQVLFVAYSVMPFVRAALRKESSWRQGFLLAIVNGLFCCWYSESLLNYQKSSGSLVSLSYAVVSLGLALLFWRQRTPGLLSSWLIAQGIVFLLVFWEQLLSNSWVTVFWSAEVVALYWAATKCNDRILLSGAFVIGLLAVLRYFADTSGFVFESSHSPLFTAEVIARWSAGLSMVMALLLVVWLDRTGRVAGSHPRLQGAFEWLGIVSLFGFLNCEWYRFTNQFSPRIGLAGFSVLWSLFAVGLILLGVWMRRKIYRISAIGLLIATVLKVLVFDTAEVSTPYRILSCLVLGIILMVVSFLYYRFSERLIK
jgi:uncharacterized membrane protein